MRGKQNKMILYGYPQEDLLPLFYLSSLYSKVEAAEQQPCSWQRFSLAQGHFSRADISSSWKPFPYLQRHVTKPAAESALRVSKHSNQHSQ